MRSWDEPGAYRIAVDTFVRVVGAGYGAVWRPGDDNELFLDHEAGALSASMATSFPEGRNPMDRGLVGRVYRSREALFVGDLADVSDCLRSVAAKSLVMTSCFCYPVLHEGRVTAVLDYYADQPFAPDPGRRSKVLAIAKIADMAVFRAIAGPSCRRSPTTAWP